MTTNACLAGGTEVLHFFELDAVVPTSLDIAPWPVPHTSACELTGRLTHTGLAAITLGQWPGLLRTSALLSCLVGL